MSAAEIPLTIVAAVARNGVIGGGNALLWHLSGDLKRFKSLTMGKPLVMGRKTFESIGKPLPGRETIVITRDPGFAAAGVLVARNLEDGLALARRRAAETGASEAIVAGGGEIYAQAMDLADRMVITHVELEPDGDTIFPAIYQDIWREVERKTYESGDRDDAGFSIVVYERRRNRQT